MTSPLSSLNAPRRISPALSPCVERWAGSAPRDTEYSSLGRLYLYFVHGLYTYVYRTTVRLVPRR